MDKENQEEKDKTSPTSEEAPESAAEESAENQDPLKKELDRVHKDGRTELEKAEYSLKKNAERLAELGGDPNTVLGIEKKPAPKDDDNTPVTRGELKKIISSGATKTALQMAEEIEDPTERELVKYYLENRIAPSGNPAEDLRDARRIANSVKNEQIVSEMARKSQPKSHSNSSGGPAKDKKDVEAELTPQESLFLAPPFNMTREQIIKARQG